MTLLVQPPIAMSLKDAVDFWRDCWFAAMLINEVNNRVRIIAFIGQNVTAFDIDLCQNVSRKCRVVLLTFWKQKVNRQTQRIDNRVNFGA